MLVSKLWSFAFGCFVSLLISVGCDKPAAQTTTAQVQTTATAPVTPAKTTPSLPDKYVVLAKVLADDIKLSPTEPDPKPDADQIIGQARQASFDLQHASSNDPQLDSIAREASDAFSTAMNQCLTLQSLPKPQGAGDDFAESFVRGLLGGHGAGAQLDRNVSRREDIVSTVRGLIATCSRLDADKILLPRVASRYAGPQASDDHCLDIDYDGVWGPHGPDDWLTLRNTSGLALHHCTIQVELLGEDGEVRQNVHFVSDWPRDTFVYAKYCPGRELLDETVNRRLVKRCASLKLSIWCDELSREAISYTYAGAERDKDVARYCAPAVVSAAYEPPSKLSLWNRSGTATLILDGVDFFPPSHAQLTFHRGDNELSYSCDVSEWKKGEKKKFEAKGLQWDPESVDVGLSFDDTNFTWHCSRQFQH
jgi:hypothetical protein